MPTDIEFETLPFDPMKRVSADWNAEPKYVCRTCGDVARMHPQTNFIWGCLKCGMTTASVCVYFEEKRDAEDQRPGRD